MNGPGVIADEHLRLREQERHLRDGRLSTQIRDRHCALRLDLRAGRGIGRRTDQNRAESILCEAVGKRRELGNRPAPLAFARSRIQRDARS
jgi:hypothetical protein